MPRNKSGEKYPRIISSSDPTEPFDAGKGWCRTCSKRYRSHTEEPCVSCVLGSYYHPTEWSKR